MNPVDSPFPPAGLVTPELVEEIQRLAADNTEESYAAALEHFRTAVGDDPWFQDPRLDGLGQTRLVGEFNAFLTDEHLVEL